MQDASTGSMNVPLLCNCVVVMQRCGEDQSPFLLNIYKILTADNYCPAFTLYHLSGKDALQPPVHDNTLQKRYIIILLHNGIHWSVVSCLLPGDLLRRWLDNSMSGGTDLSDRCSFRCPSGTNWYFGDMILLGQNPLSLSEL